jgi:CelD/BcsL family acetyltransferase involved in cellulose biosynthesis
MNFRITIKDIADEDTKLIWKNFEKNSINYCFQNYYWLKHWYDINLIRNKIKSYIVFVYRGEELIMILPLCVRTFFGVKILSWLGGNQADYMCPLVVSGLKFEKNEFLVLWRDILVSVKYFDFIFFNKQPSFIKDIENPFVHYLSSYKSSSAYSLILNNNFVHKKEKYSSSNNDINVQIVKDEKFRIKYIKRILEEKIVRLKEKKLRNPFDDNNIKFYLEFCEKDFTHGKEHISYLFIKNIEASGHWGVVYKNDFYYLLPVIFNTEFLKMSPGKILIKYLINWAAINQIQVFDFSVGNEDYKKNYSNSTLLLYDYCYCKNLKGLFHFVFYLIKKVIKSWRYA